MNHSQIHAAVEIVHKNTDRVHKTVDAAESAATVARVITASHAFRKFDWLHGVPMLNSKNTLQGMVLNSKWRAAYGVTVK